MIRFFVQCLVQYPFRPMPTPSVPIILLYAGSYDIKLFPSIEGSFTDSNQCVFLVNIRNGNFKIFDLRYRNYTTQIDHKKIQIDRLHCRAATCYEVETPTKQRSWLYSTGSYRSSNAVRCALDAMRYCPEGKWYTIACLIFMAAATSVGSAKLTPLCSTPRNCLRRTPSGDFFRALRIG